MQRIEKASLSTDIAFIDYTADKTDMQIMLYKDDQNVVHGAFNTCQVCNGSPYAYFLQEEDDVVCQNCGNHFSVNEIGTAHGGYNPVPLEYEQDEDTVKISTVYLDEKAELFINWKKEFEHVRIFSSYSYDTE